MGASGTGILEDDVTLDVYGDYIEAFNKGTSRRAILRELRRRHDGTLKDSDDQPLFWLAIAWAQWECGQLDRAVVKRVRSWISNGGDEDRWAESGQAAVRQRRRKLLAFVRKLESPRPRPRKARLLSKHRPAFVPGDCLSVQLSDGDYGALLVLNHFDGSEVDGLNVVGQLRYKSPHPPTIEVFKKREWLMLTHHRWAFWGRGRGRPNVMIVLRLGLRDALKRISVVGRIALRRAEPRPWGGGTWGFQEQIIKQLEWEKG